MSDFNDVFGANTHREPALNINTEEFVKVLKSRRSVRKYLDKKIPEEVMKECLELTLLAPNSSNLQPWEFYWIRNPEMRKKIDEAFLSQPAVTTAAEVVVAVARTNTWKGHAQRMVKVLKEHGADSALPYYTKIVPLVYSLGFLGLWGYLKKVILFFRGLKTPTPREVTDRAQLRIWAVKSTALACQNLMLSLRAFGCDSCPMEGMDSKRLKKILQLPKDAEIVMGISAGYRAEDGVYGSQFRFPSSEFIKEV